MRKPNIGMALKAKQEHPSVAFEKSILVGDSPSDMEFGKNAGMTNVMIQKELIEEQYSLASLSDFVELIESIFEPVGRG
jgi:D-glycero-D-manno-heptose 1,7-bisphosphate phosphatase